MDGEQKFIVVTVSLALICITLFGGFLLIVLWPYRVGVALSIAVAIGVVLFALVALSIIHNLNEQLLRHKRVRYHEELPLDEQSGIPYYMPGDAQMYPQQTPPYYYQPYQTQEKERTSW